MQGYIPRGIDQSYVFGFLAREIERAAARAKETASSSGNPGGAVLLLGVVRRYSQLLGGDHLALALHKLAELQQQEAAGPDEVCGTAVQGSRAQLLYLYTLEPTSDMPR